ncbi:glycoside hydrolase [Alloscardovia theropitheci]|uniref:Glycoside hydrolase n=1 Tax=Alloscardovia theropitheci TaxID=2496842 RepID=A0A4R0QYW0_9BIFI|nr:glycoside hydrolase family 30 beta sandwich domain-containing protein [Alloscardovia theropitheci]TCD55040.1 glycoside hydrolase [Alloscardovia theropitheci]
MVARYAASMKTTSFDTKTGQTTFSESTPTVLDESTLLKNVESNVVGIYPRYAFQTIEGFGCAMTESACYLLSRMSKETRTEALKAWFGNSAIDARFIRIPLDSCDYSLDEYQAVEDPISDPSLATFSMERNNKYIIPVVKEALEIADGKISALLSPWSPPVQWKTAPEISENDAKVYGDFGFEVPTEPSRNFGGRLKREYYKPWAQYLVTYVQAYLDAGIPVTMLSIQNEASAATMWDSCLWSGEEESTFLHDYLYPAMKEAGLLEKVGIFIWDHNKERMLEHVDEMFETDIADMISGIAYHWYSGDHFEALDLIHNAYPDKILMHSESCGLHIPGKTYAFKPVDGPEPESTVTPIEMDFADAVMYAHDMIGDINHGMQRWIDWNLCVDRTGGPRHVLGGFAAPIVAEDNGTFEKTISYHYIAQIAHVVQPGSIRIGSSTWSDTVEVAAVKRPDDSIGIILLNKHDNDQEVNIRVSGQLSTVNLPAHTLSSVILNEQ